MNPYTHFRLAAQVEPLFTPQQPAIYYWGSVAPDVRCMAGLPRAQTHRSRGELQALHERYPQMESFLQGYRLHCLLDEIDLVRAISSAFPLRLFRRMLPGRLSQQHAAVLVELHYLQGPHPALLFDGRHNPVLEGMGIQAEVSRAFAAGLQEYLFAPSIASAMIAFERLGFLRSERGAGYVKAARSLEKSPLLANLLLWFTRNARLEQQVERHIRGALNCAQQD